MDARSALGHLTRRTAGMVLHPKQTAREVAGDVRGAVGAGVGVAGHVVGGAVHRAGSLLDRGRDTTSDRIVDLVSDPRPAAARPDPDAPDKLHGDPLAPDARRATTRAMPVKKTSTAKTATKKTAAKKTAAKKSAAKKSAAKKPVAKTTTPRQKDPVPAPPWTEPEADAEEIRTPSGIPAAGPGHNPSTGDTTDLTQPGTEPLVSASSAKAARKEAEMMRRAASTEVEDS